MIDRPAAVRSEPGVTILGSHVDLPSVEAVVEQVDNWIRVRDGVCHRIVVTGFHGLWEACKDGELRRILNTADLWVPDGIAPVWIARMRGHARAERIPGAELMSALFEHGAAHGYRHFFYGDTDPVLTRLREVVEQRWPGNVVADALSPPFRELSAAEVDAHIEAINAARPDILWVGLGMPKQDRWIHAHRERLRVPVATGVGAAFAFLAGTVPRAPGWVGRSGLEWAYRLLREPRKCWRRSMVEGPRFLARVLQEQRVQASRRGSDDPAPTLRRASVRRARSARQALPRVAFVIPTKDRPEELRTMLTSLAAQEVKPAQVVIVDASAMTEPEIAAAFPDLPIEYVCFEGTPSAAAQRNAGARRVAADTDLICFFDDDQTLLPGALGAMLAFWQDAEPNVAGAGFNLRNEIDRRPSALKRSRLAEWLGLYARRRGAVAPSGWQTLPGVVRRDREVEWLTTGAAVWRRRLFEAHGFDEFYGSYSYLEDLDFSYGVSRSQRLVIVAAAGVHHYPSRRGRVSLYRFGLMEVRNRLHFVRKHGLSVARCRAALAIRMSMSLGMGLVLPWRGGLRRAWGNVVGLFGGGGATP